MSLSRLSAFVFAQGDTLMRLTRVGRPVATLAVLVISVPSAVLAILGLFYWYRADRRFFWLASLTISYLPWSLQVATRSRVFGFLLCRCTQY